MDEDIRAIVPLVTQQLAVHPPEQVAAEVVKVLDFLTGRLELETPHPSTANRVRGARTVPREFVVSLIAAAESRPDLRLLGQFDSAAAREAMESVEACRLVAERMVLFLANLNYTIEARWARVVADAMGTFSLASIAAKDPKEADLAAEVENLRRQLGRSGTRKKKKGAKTVEPGFVP